MDRLEARRLTGAFWHQGAARFSVPSFADPASTDGRYHRRQGPGVWYASDQEQAAWAELFRHFTEEGVDPFEVHRRVGRVVVEGLEVLDLTSGQVRATLGLTLEDLIGDDYQRTQAVTAAATNAGYQGILAPSAAMDGRRTLIVFAAEREVLRRCRRLDSLAEAGFVGACRL